MLVVVLVNDAVVEDKSAIGWRMGDIRILVAIHFDKFIWLTCLLRILFHFNIPSHILLFPL